MYRTILLLACVLLLSVITPMQAQTVSQEEARTIADNWIQIVIDSKGNWGKSNEASVHSVHEFQFRNRTIGYHCEVYPQGFVIVSLRKELSPVKAYSSLQNLNRESEQGMPLIIKSRMLQIIEHIESRLGLLRNADGGSIAELSRTDYESLWNFIEQYQSGMQIQPLDYTEDYQEGDFLLTSFWHQFDPYNNDCPDLGCTSTANGRALVGCVATAGAQIMKYWAWPPDGEASAPYTDAYDWVNMPDEATVFSSDDEQAAVAELCSEVGEAVGMNYGCDGSGAVTANMVSVYEDHFRYDNSCDVVYYRIDYTDQEWWDMLKGQINMNRPTQYRIDGHSIVCDGWQELTGGLWQYHINYGWQDKGFTTWYDFDDIFNTSVDSEYVVLNIVPEPALGPSLSGVYEKTSYGYRYFDRDASGSAVEFRAGQMLQARPGRIITGTWNGYVKIHGSATDETRLFTNGDPSKGMKVKEGSIQLTDMGSIRIY